MKTAAAKSVCVVFVLVMFGGMPAVGQSQADSTSKWLWPTGKYGWAVGANAQNRGYILYTRDGGATWVNQVAADGMPMKLSGISAVSQTVAYAVGLACDGYCTILKTRHFGRTWQRLGSAATLPDVDLSIVSAADAYVVWVVGPGGMILKTSNGGQTWTQQAEGMFPTFDFQDVFALDRLHVWAVAADSINNKALIIHTTNGGRRWEISGEAAIPGDVYGILGVHAVDENTVWAAGVNGIVMLTTDGGKNWSTSRTPVAFYHNNHVVAIDEQTAWVSCDYGHIFYTQDGGTTWTDQLASSFSKTTPYVMGITAVDGTRAWAVSSNTDGTGYIYHTDNGQNWYQQTNPVVTTLWRISFARALR